MPLTRERTLEQEAERCLAGRKVARSIGQWNDDERRELARCLAMPSCDEVTECMKPKPSAAASSAPTTSAPAPTSSVDSAPVLDDIRGLPHAHPERTYVAQEEGGLSGFVPGAKELGCKTIVIESWFWVRCGNDERRVQRIDIDKGKHQTQTQVKIENGVGTILTPFVKGTDLRAKWTFDDGERWQTLTWPAGPRPRQVGTMSDRP